MALAAAGAEAAAAAAQKRQLSVASALARSHTFTPPGPGERRPRDIGIEINNKVQRVREERLIDVEGLAGVSHSPEALGWGEGKEAGLPCPAGSPASWGRCACARARAGARRPACFLLYSGCFFLLLSSWLACRAELGGW